jgi:hypothetical protein
VKDDDNTILPGENPAETMRKVMERIAGHEVIQSFGDAAPTDVTAPLLVTLPEGRRVENLHRHMIEAVEFMKPLRRRGTARLKDVVSLIAWANRFKSEHSVLFANPDREAPAITCIADFHKAGPATVSLERGDPAAMPCAHKAIYSFPLSDEWKAWTGISGRALDKDELGEFIEVNAKDIMDPTPAVLARDSSKAEPWEERLIDTARQIDGRYGQLAQLLQMSRSFQVHETSNLTVTSNRDTGEGSIQFLNEHNDKDGAPIKIPNLFIIAIPVFLNGAAFRLPVRFRYRKSGSQVKFVLSPYNPQRAFDLAFNEAVEMVSASTDLPLFLGSPESNS